MLNTSSVNAQQLHKAKDKVVYALLYYTTVSGSCFNTYGYLLKRNHQIRQKNKLQACKLLYGSFSLNHKLRKAMGMINVKLPLMFNKSELLPKTDIAYFHSSTGSVRAFVQVGDLEFRCL